MAHSFRNSRSRQSLCLGSHLLADRLVPGAGLEGACSELLGFAAEKPENFRGLVLVINEAPFTGDVTWPVVVSLAWTAAFFLGVAAALKTGLQYAGLSVPFRYLPALPSLPAL